MINIELVLFMVIQMYDTRDIYIYVVLIKFILVVVCAMSTVAGRA